jgi:hypothetical protein
VDGHILAPREHRGHDIKVRVTPVGPDMRFDRAGLNRVGWFYLPTVTPAQGGYSANLLLPEAYLTLLAAALSATAKYLNIWTSDLDGDTDEAIVSDYGLSSTIPDKVKPWAGVD